MDEQLTWFKSSYSGSPSEDCVETALLADGIAVRDSKIADGPSFRLSAVAWSGFTAELKGGAFNGRGN